MQENIDKNEIAKFAKSAAAWWDTEGEFKTLHDINPLRLQFIKDHAALKNKKVLDVGCGAGILAESLAAQGAEVTAIDLAAPLLETARKHAKQSQLTINYQQITVEELAKDAPQQFEVITCLEMLEHVPDPASIIASCAKLIKPGGQLFFSTINRTMKAYALAIVAGEYILKILPKHTHEYSKFIRPSELSNWLRENKLTTKEITGMTYSPWSRTASLSKDIDVNYLVCCEAS